MEGDMNRITSERGALHLVGIFFIVLLLGVLFLLSSWSHDVSELRSSVAGLNQRVQMLEMKVLALQGKTGP